MKIVTASDAAFLPGVVALAKSLARYGYPLELLYAGAIPSCGSEDGGSEDVRWAFRNCLVRIVDVSDSIPTNKSGGKASWARMLIPTLYPNEERVLYLDSDIICIGDIEPLLSADLQGQPTGACRDGAMTDLAVQTLGSVPRDEPAFNSGVLLMDLQAWRKERVTEKTFELAPILAGMGRIWSFDQACLNVAHFGGFHVLPRRFNFTLLPRWDLPPAGEASLIHYVGRPKPWEDRTRPGSGAWWAEYEREV